MEVEASAEGEDVGAVEETQEEEDLVGAEVKAEAEEAVVPQLLIHMI